jgi:hypothetical protein
MREPQTCPRAGRLIGGCKFSPRYDSHAYSAEQIKALAYAGGWRIPGTVTYVRDVCERCGKTIERAA